jgi:hypothetical protein
MLEISREKIYTDGLKIFRSEELKIYFLYPWRHVYNMVAVRSRFLRASENYLAISRSASTSVEIFWAEIYWGRLFFRAESSLIQSNCRSLIQIIVPYKISKEVHHRRNRTSHKV